MSTREQIVQMLDQVPDYCLVNLQAYIQGMIAADEAADEMIAADEAADDVYCEQLYREYEKDPDRGQYMTEAELCKELGITL